MPKGRAVPPKPEPATVDYMRLGNALCDVFTARYGTNTRAFCWPLALTGWEWLIHRGIKAIVNIGDLAIAVEPERIWEYTVERPGDRLQNGDFHAWVVIDGAPPILFDPTARYWKDNVLILPQNRWERDDVPPTLVGTLDTITALNVWHRADPPLTRRAIGIFMDDQWQRQEIRSLLPMVNTLYNNDDALFGPGSA